MERIINTLTGKKKVSLNDVVQPKPSRAASRTIQNALKSAHKDQLRVTEQANRLRVKK